MQKQIASDQRLDAGRPGNEAIYLPVCVVSGGNRHTCTYKTSVHNQSSMFVDYKTILFSLGMMWRGACLSV